MLAACSTPTPVQPNLESATFLLANPSGIVALDSEGRTLGPIVELPKDSAPSAPALFPDGRAIVFGITLPLRADTGFGSDIWTVNLDGTGLRALVEHEAENVFYASPVVDPSGNAIYVQRRAAIVKDGMYIGNEDSIERIDLATKERKRIAEQAADLTLSPDGKTIVYVKVVDGQPQGLWRVNADGTGQAPFFTIADTWWYLQAPRFSPDGRTVMFSAAGHNARSDTAVRGLAHLGIPSDLFLAPADGSSVKTVAQTGDDVVPAWSPDGTQVAFVALGALHVATVSDGAVRQLTDGSDFFFGDLLWLRR